MYCTLIYWLNRRVNPVTVDLILVGTTSLKVTDKMTIPEEAIALQMLAIIPVIQNGNFIKNKNIIKDPHLRRKGHKSSNDQSMQRNFLGNCVWCKCVLDYKNRNSAADFFLPSDIITKVPTISPGISTIPFMAVPRYKLPLKNYFNSILENY